MQLEIIGFILLLLVLNSILSFFSKSRGVAYCGLIGFSGKESFDLNKIKLLMFWNSVERGMDSTGIFTPISGIVKDNVKASLYLSSIRNIGSVSPDTVLIGHVRAKTIGANSIKNAHPFNFGSITGAHNGTLKNHLQIATNYSISYHSFDVDSQVIFNAMSQDFKKGENKFKVLSEYEGAAALLFYDDQEDVLYACHDKERPLYLGYDSGGNMYISSIREALEVIDCFAIEALDTNVVYKIKDGNILDKIAYKTYVKPTTECIVARTASHIDIIYTTKNNKSTMRLSPNCKGIATACAEAHMFKGFWVRVDSLYVDDPAIGHDRWYECINYEKNVPNREARLVLTNSDKKTSLLKVSEIDAINFIPVKDNFVKLMVSLLEEKDSDVVTAHKGQICKVVEYKYGDHILDVENPNNGQTMTVMLKHVRVLTYRELNKYKDMLVAEAIDRKTKEMEDLWTAQRLLPTVRPDSEYPFCDKNEIEDTLGIDDDKLVDEDKEDDAELFIPHNLYCDLIDSIRTKVQDIDFTLLEGKVDESMTLTSDLLGHLGKCYELSYLEKTLQE